MQTKAGGAAKTFCAEEVWDVVVEDFMVQANKVMREAFKGDKDKMRRMTPIFSLDNASVHLDIKRDFADEMAPLPPCSPDMHKVIEHVWNTISHDFKQHQLPAISALNKQSPLSATFWPKLVYDCAQRLITVESTRKDVLSLPLTYKYIAEHGGQYAPHPYN
jgi:hypothetical protein